MHDLWPSSRNMPRRFRRGGLPRKWPSASVVATLCAELAAGCAFSDGRVAKVWRCRSVRSKGCTRSPAPATCRGLLRRCGLNVSVAKRSAMQRARCPVPKCVVDGVRREDPEAARAMVSQRLFDWRRAALSRTGTRRVARRRLPCARGGSMPPCGPRTHGKRCALSCRAHTRGRGAVLSAAPALQRRLRRNPPECRSGSVQRPIWRLVPL